MGNNIKAIWNLGDPTDSYFDQTEKMNIQKLMIDRLMKEPLQQL